MLFISRAESSEAFLRVSARFSCGFALTAFLAGYSAGLPWIDQLPVILVFLSSLTYLSRSYLPLRLLTVGIILFTPVLLFVNHQEPLFVFNMLLSSLTLGGAFVGQFLGHWYLNVPNIHIREFKRITNMAFGSIVLRASILILIYVLIPFLAPTASDPNLGVLPSGDFFDLRGNYWNGLSSYGALLFGSRVIWGIVAPLVLTWMAKKTVDMRSTQSATGIFYANSVLMLLGELCALYLEKELKWPV